MVGSRRCFCPVRVVSGAALGSVTLRRRTRCRSGSGTVPRAARDGRCQPAVPARLVSQRGSHRRKWQLVSPARDTGPLDSDTPGPAGPVRRGGWCVVGRSWCIHCGAVGPGGLSYCVGRREGSSVVVKVTAAAVLHTWQRRGGCTVPGRYGPPSLQLSELSLGWERPAGGPGRATAGSPAL